MAETITIRQTLEGFLEAPVDERSYWGGAIEYIVGMWGETPEMTQELSDGLMHELEIHMTTAEEYQQAVWDFTDRPDHEEIDPKELIGAALSEAHLRHLTMARAISVIDDRVATYLKWEKYGDN